MTVSESLKSINNYPIPPYVLTKSAIKNGMSLEEEVTSEILISREYRLMEADVYAFLAGAPDVTQNGITFSFSQDQRDWFLSMSNSIKTDLGVVDSSTGQGYGYMGEDY